MKYLFTLLGCALFISSQAQTKLSSDQWRQDLDYFQKLVHTKYEPLFYRVTKQDFDSAVASLRKDIPNLERHEIIVGFAKLAAMFKYGHTGMPLAFSMHGPAVKTGFHKIPINFYIFSDGLFVQGIHKDYEKAVGAKVIKIGTKSIDEALDAIRPVVSIENEQFFKSYGVKYLSIPEVLHAQGISQSLTNVPIRFEKDGKQFTINFPVKEGVEIPAYYGFVFGGNEWVISRDLNQTPLWIENIQKAYHFKYLEASKTLYVRQSQIRDDPSENIPSFYKRVFDFVDNNPVEKFILDLRVNSGGNNQKNKPVILGLIQSKVNKKGKLFTIIGRSTFSAAQNLVNELEKYTETTFIGEPTAENVNFFGDVQIETLPISNLDVRLSYLWWQNHDPRDMRLWTAPEINVEMSSEDYRTNQDPVLEAVLSYKSNVPDVMAVIRSKYEQKDYKGAELTAFSFKDNPENKFIGINNEMNALGYQFMNNNDFPTALAIFTTNTKLYPTIANGWDSLAEAYMNQRDFKKAALYYGKALELDPNGPTGKNAKDQLDKMKAYGGNK